MTKIHHNKNKGHPEILIDFQECFLQMGKKIQDFNRIKYTFIKQVDSPMLFCLHSQDFQLADLSSKVSGNSIMLSRNCWNVESSLASMLKLSFSEMASNIFCFSTFIVFLLISLKFFGIVHKLHTSNFEFHSGLFHCYIGPKSIYVCNFPLWLKFDKSVFLIFFLHKFYGWSLLNCAQIFCFSFYKMLYQNFNCFVRFLHFLFTYTEYLRTFVQFVPNLSHFRAPYYLFRDFFFLSASFRPLFSNYTDPVTQIFSPRFSLILSNCQFFFIRRFFVCCAAILYWFNTKLIHLVECKVEISNKNEANFNVKVKFLWKNDVISRNFVILRKDGKKFAPKKLISWKLATNYSCN